MWTKVTFGFLNVPRGGGGVNGLGPFPKFYHFLVASLIHHIPTTGKVHLGADSCVEDDAEVEGGVAHHHLQAPHALRVEGAHKQVLQNARHLCRRLLVIEFFFQISC